MLQKKEDKYCRTTWAERKLSLLKKKILQRKESEKRKEKTLSWVSAYTYAKENVAKKTECKTTWAEHQITLWPKNEEFSENGKKWEKFENNKKA